MDNAPHGTLYRKNGYYYARIYYYADGRRKSKDRATGIAIESRSARKAKQQERAANQELERFLRSFTASMTGQTRRPQQQTVAETVKIWLDHISGTKAPGTIAGYTYIANDITLYFTNVAPVLTAELTTSQVEAYLAWERMRRQPEYAGTYKVSALYADGSGIENTVHHRYTVLRAILQYAKREGIVTRNVASKRDCQIDVPKPQQQEFAVLNVDEARELLRELDHAPLWFRAAVMLGLLLGLRRSEVIGLRASDLDWENHILTVRRTATQQTIGGRNTVTIKPYTKNRHPKTFVITDNLTDLLQKLCNEHAQNEEMFGRAYVQDWNGYLMRYKDGQLISPNALTRAFSQFIEKHGFKKVRYHDLRHSCASILYANGTDIMTIQEILGHAQLTTTLMYTHKLSDRKTLALAQIDAQFLGVDKEKSEK